MKWLRVKFNCMGGGGNKLDLMLADVCGSGTLRVLPFSVCLWVRLLGIHVSTEGCIKSFTVYTWCHITVVV